MIVSDICKNPTGKYDSVKIATAPRRQTPGITDILFNGALRPARQGEIFIKPRDARIVRNRRPAMPPLRARRIRKTVLARRITRGDDGLAAGGAFSELFFCSS